MCGTSIKESSTDPYDYNQLFADDDCQTEAFLRHLSPDILAKIRQQPKSNWK